MKFVNSIVDTLNDILSVRKQFRIPKICERKSCQMK